MGTAAYRRRELLYLLLIGTQKRMLSICINRLCRFRPYRFQVKWTPKFGPVGKLDFSGSVGHEKPAELCRPNSPRMTASAENGRAVSTRALLLCRCHPRRSRPQLHTRGIRSHAGPRVRVGIEPQRKKQGSLTIALSVHSIDCAAAAVPATRCQ